jgi:hypothetical protein
MKPLRDLSFEELTDSLITKPREVDSQEYQALRFGIQSEILKREKTIYGVDDRQEIIQVDEPAVQKVSRSVVALFSASRLKDIGNDSFELILRRHGDAKGLCAGQLFENQSSGAFGSGFLVAKDIVATAGHCIQLSSLHTVRFVFGFKVVTPPDEISFRVPSSEVYSAKRVIGRRLTASGADWCLVQLNREVDNHDPLVLRKDVSVGDKVYVVGHPSGLPMKFAAGGAEIRVVNDECFIANLDTFGGNSGSPVFSVTHNEVVGVLVRGQADYIDNELGSCRIAASYPTTGPEGEDCTKVGQFADLINVG